MGTVEWPVVRYYHGGALSDGEALGCRVCRKVFDPVVKNEAKKARMTGAFVARHRPCGSLLTDSLVVVESRSQPLWRPGDGAWGEDAQAEDPEKPVRAGASSGALRLGFGPSGRQTGG